jgi:hypothetical protein
MNRVRVGSLYAYTPCIMDVISPPVGNPEKGDILRVINKHGCPKANTMGMCYVEQLDGEFMGLVLTSSLTHVTMKNGKIYMDVFDKIDYDRS